jgi:hypothetical protein
MSSRPNLKIDFCLSGIGMSRYTVAKVQRIHDDAFSFNFSVKLTAFR